MTPFSVAVLIALGIGLTAPLVVGVILAWVANQKDKAD